MQDGAAQRGTVGYRVVHILTTLFPMNDDHPHQFLPKLTWTLRLLERFRKFFFFLGSRGSSTGPAMTDVLCSQRVKISAFFQQTNYPPGLHNKSPAITSDNHHHHHYHTDNHHAWTQPPLCAQDYVNMFPPTPTFMQNRHEPSVIGEQIRLYKNRCFELTHP